MCSLRFSCSVLLAVLLMSATVSAEVYDDEGWIIAEAEIRAEMGDGFRTGCCIFGGLLSLGGSAVAVAMAGLAEAFGTFDRADLVVMASAAGSIVIISGSYYVGKALDRRAAIKRIKVERGAFRPIYKSPLRTDVILPLLAVRF